LDRRRIVQRPVRPHGACRAAIIETLHDHPRTLAELAETLPCPPTCLAMSLSHLRDAGVITCQPSRASLADRTSVLYELNPSRTLPPASRLYKHLTATDLVVLATSAQLFQYDPGELIFLEGSPCQGLYLVDTGLIRLTMQGPESACSDSGAVRQQIVELVGAGACIGALEAVDGGTNATTAEAVEQTQLLLIPQAVVQELLKSSPTFAATMAVEVGVNLRHALTLVQDLSLRNVDSRVAKVLLQRVETRPGIGAGAQCRTRLTQQELAEMAGTVREVAARSLKRLASRGAIRLDGGQVVILDRNKLDQAL
jgi:CRP/FNR family transcriptional regulator